MSQGRKLNCMLCLQEFTRFWFPNYPNWKYELCNLLCYAHVLISCFEGCLLSLHLVLVLQLYFLSIIWVEINHQLVLSSSEIACSTAYRSFENEKKSWYQKISCIFWKTALCPEKSSRGCLRNLKHIKCSEWKSDCKLSLSSMII